MTIPGFSEHSATAHWHAGRSPRLGVSSCLLGHTVRWDGSHKRDALLCVGLAPFVEWVPVCPELELGLGVPRQTLRLEGNSLRPDLVQPSTGRNWSEPMRRFARRRVRALAGDALSGFVLKSKSPSCGFERVPVFPNTGDSQPVGRGLFAESLAASRPDLPVLEESGLRDVQVRESFFERVFALHRLHCLFSAPRSRAEILAFHRAHKLQLAAHSPDGARALGALVRALPSRFGECSGGEFRDHYRPLFLQVLGEEATPTQRGRVYLHIARCMRDHLTPKERVEIQVLIECFRVGALPQAIPLARLRDCVHRTDISPLAGQVVLEPYPDVLGQRDFP